MFAEAETDGGVTTTGYQSTASGQKLIRVFGKIGMVPIRLLWNTISLLRFKMKLTNRDQ